MTDADGPRQEHRWRWTRTASGVQLVALALVLGWLFFDYPYLPCAAGAAFVVVVAVMALWPRR